MTVLPLSPTTISDVQAGDYPYTPRSKCIAQTWDFCALEQRSPGAIVRCSRIGDPAVCGGEISVRSTTGLVRG